MERNGIKICPYWRRFAKRGDYILALCGTKFPNEQLASSTDLDPRQQECPIFGKLALPNAFMHPQIREFEVSSTGEYGLSSMTISALFGEEGVNYLERIWNREVRKFVKRHP